MFLEKYFHPSLNFRRALPLRIDHAPQCAAASAAETPLFESNATPANGDFMTAPKYNIGDEVVAMVRGRVTAVTEYANSCYSYRITGTEPAGDRYNKFIDEQFVLPCGAAVAPTAANDDIPLPASLTRAA